MEKSLMTVGEAAKKLGVTVRTLQFYDQSGLLKPSNKSEGGRRLYGSKEWQDRRPVIEAFIKEGLRDYFKNNSILLPRMEEPKT